MFQLRISSFHLLIKTKQILITVIRDYFTVIEKKETKTFRGYKIGSFKIMHRSCSEFFFFKCLCI